MVALQNFNMALLMDSAISRALRQYVWYGGGLFIAHDSAWLMDSPFPHITVRAVPTRNEEAGRHVAETDLVVTQAHPTLGNLQPGTQFTP